MLDSGKLTLLTGTHAQEDMPHVTPTQTSNALLKCTDGEETPGNSGLPTPLVDVDF